ncbi:Rz1 lysis protein [Aeromonas phage phiARM81ld]|nr:Rz1 lysis protein [Aeromonas phage phiARM81ld]
MAKRALMLMLLLSMTAVSGCATSSAALPKPNDPTLCPRPAPPPAAVMKPRKADFSQRMQSFLFDSDTKPTTSSGS